MANTSKKNAKVSETVETKVEAVTNEDVGNLSEAQEQVLANAEVPEVVEVEPAAAEVEPKVDTVEPKTVEEQPKVEAEKPKVSDLDTLNTVEEIEAAYSEAVIDESDLAMLVHAEKLSPEKFEELTGEKYVMPDDADGSPFQKMKMSLENSLEGGKLNLQGARVMVEAWFSRNELTEAQKTKLLEWLGSNTAHNPVKKEILASYHPPVANLEEAKEEATKAAEAIISATVEIETTKVSQLRLAFADIAFFLMQADKLPVSPNIAEALWARIQEGEMLGKVTHVYDENKAIVGTTDPYRDRSIQPLIKPTCMVACLLAYGAATQVQFGWIKKSTVPGKRLDTKLVFTASIPEGEDEAEYLRDVCIPSNVLRPHKYALTSEETEQKDKMGKITKISTWIMRPLEENDDNSLRHLTGDVATGLYGKYFKDEELTYDLVSYTKKIPTGYISGSEKPESEADRIIRLEKEAREEAEAAEVKKRQTAGTQAEATKDDVIKQQQREIAELKKDNNALAQEKGEDIANALLALRGIVRDEKIEFPVTTRMILWDAVHEMFIRRIRVTNKPPQQEEAKLITDLLTELDGMFRWDANKATWSYVSVDGTLRHEYKPFKDGNGTKKAA